MKTIHLKQQHLHLPMFGAVQCEQCAALWEEIKAVTRRSAQPLGERPWRGRVPGWCGGARLRGEARLTKGRPPPGSARAEQLFLTRGSACRAARAGDAGRLLWCGHKAPRRAGVCWGCLHTVPCLPVTGPLPLAKSLETWTSTCLPLGTSNLVLVERDKPSLC